MASVDKDLRRQFDSVRDKNLPLKYFDFYIETFPVGENGLYRGYVSDKDLVDKEGKNFNSVDKIIWARDNGNLYIKHKNGTAIPVKSLIVYSNKISEVATETLTKTVKTKTTVVYNKNDIITKSLTLVDSTDFSESIKDSYLNVVFYGFRYPTAVKFTALQYYEGSTLVAVSTKTFSSAEKFAEFCNKNILYANGKVINSIDPQNLYKERENSLISKEIITKENGTIKKETIDLTSEDHEVIESREISSTYVERTPFSKMVGKKEIKKYKVRKFEISEDGKFIRVVKAGDTLPSIVKIEELYTDKECTTKVKNLEEQIGKTLYLKEGDTVIEIPQLTKEQAILRYNSKPFYEKTEKEEDVCKENAYLKLSNDEYYKESEVAQPMSYKYATDDSEKKKARFFMFTVDGKTYVVDKTKSKSKNTITINGKTLLFKDAVALVPCSFNSAEVVQTTSSGQVVESCKDISKLEEAKRKEEKDKLKGFFLEDYKANKYKLERVCIEDGKVLEIIGRYLSQEEIEVNGSSQVTSERGAVKLSPIELIKDKNGNVIGIKGGAKYSYAESNKKAFKELGEIVKTTAMFTFSGLGILAAVAAPPLALGVFAAEVLAVPLIPIINGIRGAVNNIKLKRKAEDLRQHDLVDKVTNERTTTLKRTKSKMASIEKQLKKGKMTAEEVRQFIKSECLELREDLELVGEMRVFASCEVKDGKVETNNDNAVIAMAYAQEVEALLKGKKGLIALRKRLEKNPEDAELRAEVEHKEKLLQNLTRDGTYIPRPVDEADPRITEKVREIDTFEQYLITKYCAIAETRYEYNKQLAEYKEYIKGKKLKKEDKKTKKTDLGLDKLKDKQKKLGKLSYDTYVPELVEGSSAPKPEGSSAPKPVEPFNPEGGKDPTNEQVMDILSKVLKARERLKNAMNLGKPKKDYKKYATVYKTYEKALRIIFGDTKYNSYIKTIGTEFGITNLSLDKIKSIFEQFYTYDARVRQKQIRKEEEQRREAEQLRAENVSAGL